MRLLLATRNAGKLKEFRELMSGLPIECTFLSELGIAEEIAETGKTFLENAILKARGYAALSGLVTLADDSGLEVDALGGAPGVQSARWAGPDASDMDRIRLLLGRLRGVPPEQRGAQFRCVAAMATPGGQVCTTEGAIRGEIIDTPRGSHGFGYDPVFFIPELGATMAELAPQVKNHISHRARALAAARPILAEMAAREGQGQAHGR
ncbi:MAG TPA: XTP/dITP diphosphatase [Anaerolineae bacterium]|nr:XTP/dITP diphosphatase [Anaerolineae bacterium]HPL27625.1 XTP/dITP diphosphatase [Anaerolineae bacterium]